MNEKGATMQTEGLDEAPPKAGSPMTFTETSRAGDTPSPIKAALTSDDSKTDHLINFEDDIEKVEVSSNETSDEDDAVPEQHPNESIKSWLQRITDLQKKLEPLPAQKPPPQVQQAPSRVVKFQDLPYMGEMTLDNSKPRRGRKPKKADICHLIYKNYGTIFPGTPNPKSYLENSKKNDKDDANRSDVQNKIISSLLEKRLTQEIKKTDQVKKVPSLKEPEPLNLCIRDLNHLKIRFLKKTDNTYTSEIKSEPQSDDDVEFVQETPPIKPEVFGTQEEAPGGYVYWPNAGVFIHPMALQQQLMYYQRMAANNSYTLPNHSPRPPPEEPPHGHQELRKIIPKTRHHKKEDETETQKTKRTSTCPDKTPAKRKRSAIFIPPIPAESNTNPATEVSICKFKFTGGAKPSLQEKKMLSVDSGGNFRYYSGTGDKSMRGYEFFPRETLQQQVNNTQGSSTGAFLQASGEKIFTPDFPKPEFLLSPAEIPAQVAPIQESQRHKSKRKSRKSLQREKLEQTFKEKGFLIQTQQLESAEGATYCKFRQLRKFTRYLFRSWKDYLPGNVRELQEGEKIDAVEDGGVEPDVDNISRHSSELSNNCAQL